MALTQKDKDAIIRTWLYWEMFGNFNNNPLYGQYNGGLWSRLYDFIADKSWH